VFSPHLRTDLLVPRDFEDYVVAQAELDVVVLNLELDRVPVVFECVLIHLKLFYPFVRILLGVRLHPPLPVGIRDLLVEVEFENTFAAIGVGIGIGTGFSIRFD